MKAAKQFGFVAIVCLPVIIGLEHTGLSSGLKFVIGLGMGSIAMLWALRIWR